MPRHRIAPSVIAALTFVAGCTDADKPSAPAPASTGKMESGKMDGMSTGKMDGMSTGKMESGKMESGKMESGKMESGKMESGKMEGPMDKMAPKGN